MKISIIVPALNEGKSLYHILSCLRLTDKEELIVVDGGSADNTLSIASGFTDKVFEAGTGRGIQMNFGAQKAQGEILLFLHADCVLPEKGLGTVRKVMSDKNVSLGAFDIAIDHPSLIFRIIECGANVRSRVTGIPYGDQGMFMRKSVFEEVGGFAEIPLMEDIEISRRLKRTGRVSFVRPPIITSPRRWLKEGPIYATLKDWWLALSYRFFSKSPERLVRYYKDIR